MQLKIVMKILFILIMFLSLSARSALATVLPLGWPWHGVSIQNTDPFDPADLEQMVKKLHINSIQIRLLPRLVAERQKVSPDVAWQQSLNWGSSMLDQCKRLGLVAQMTVEGGYPLDPTLQLMSDDKRFWSDAKRQDEAVDIALKLSAYFAKRGPELGAYQLMSEPVMNEGGKALSPPQWRELMNKIIVAIRHNDPNRWIAVALPPGGGPNLYKGFEPFNAPRIIYGAHMFIPQAFTHQGILQWEKETHTYPGRIGLKFWDKQSLREIMTPLRDFQLRYQVPVWIGEFGSVVWSQGGEQYIIDLIDIFSEWDWSWTYFSMNGYFGWNPDYDNVRPEPMNTWPTHYVGESSLRWKTLSKAVKE